MSTAVGDVRPSSLAAIRVGIAMAIGLSAIWLLLVAPAAGTPRPIEDVIAISGPYVSSMADETVSGRGLNSARVVQFGSPYAYAVFALWVHFTQGRLAGAALFLAALHLLAAVVVFRLIRVGSPERRPAVLVAISACLLVGPAAAGTTMMVARSGDILAAIFAGLALHVRFAAPTRVIWPSICYFFALLFDSSSLGILPALIFVAPDGEASSQRSRERMRIAWVLALAVILYIVWFRWGIWTPQSTARASTASGHASRLDLELGAAFARIVLPPLPEMALARQGVPLWLDVLRVLLLATVLAPLASRRGHLSLRQDLVLLSVVVASTIVSVLDGLVSGRSNPWTSLSIPTVAILVLAARESAARMLPRALVPILALLIVDGLVMQATVKEEVASARAASRLHENLRSFVADLGPYPGEPLVLLGVPEPIDRRSEFAVEAMRRAVQFPYVEDPIDLKVLVRSGPSTIDGVASFESVFARPFYGILAELIANSDGEEVVSLVRPSDTYESSESSGFSELDPRDGRHLVLDPTSGGVLAMRGVIARRDVERIEIEVIAAHGRVLRSVMARISEVHPTAQRTFEAVVPIANTGFLRSGDGETLAWFAVARSGDGDVVEIGPISTFGLRVR